MTVICLNSILEKNIMNHSQFTFQSWCLKLCYGGHQITHFHPYGTISGIYYIDVSTKRNSSQGWLELNASSQFIKGSANINHLKRVKPTNGMLILFPSWLYHRTVPTSTKKARYSLAFDLAPSINKN